MILFLYGEEDYLTWQKVISLKKKYIDASLGTTNLVELDGISLDYKIFSRQVLTLPFLAKTRLVIVNNLFSNKKKKLLEQVADFLPQVPNTTVLVFYENKMPDKRLGFYKKLIKTAKCQEFKKMNEYRLKEWITDRMKECSIQDNLKNQIIIELLKSNNNLWKIDNEIEKIKLYLIDNNNVIIEDVKQLISYKMQDNIFLFLEYLASKDIQKAVTLLQDLFDLQVNELYILTMMVYEYRQLLIIREFTDNKNYMQITKLVGLNPYVVNKNLSLAKKYSMEELKKIYFKFLQMDEKIKSGQINSRLALDLLIVDICK